MSFLHSILAASLLLCLPATSKAHDPGLSSLTIEVLATSATATLRLSKEDAARVGGSAAFPANTFDVRFDGRSGVAEAATSETDADGGLVRTVRFAATGRQVSAAPVLVPGLSEGHRQLVRVRQGGETLRTALLTAGDAPLRVELGPPRPAAATFARLGFEHVLQGFDHLLFLLALLLVCPGMGDVLRTTVAFTVAHSITLAMASVGDVHVPASWVEPAIAATVVLAAFRAGRGRSSGAARFAFGFGLLHGLGFAGMLRELLDQAEGVGLPMLFFNLGVEAGQMLVVAGVLPILWALARRPELFATIRPVLAASIAGVGAIWLVDRVGWPIG